MANEQEPTREDDEAVERLICLAKQGWGLEDMAVDLERDPIWVAQMIGAHADCFADEFAAAN